MREGRLPDVPALVRHLEEMRVGAALRGVEATAEGVLQEAEGELRLRISGTEQTVRLAPNKRTVYWDVARKREQKLGAGEQRACSRLRSEWRGRKTPVRIVGPLVEGAEGGLYTLEVRQFNWLR